jgi:formylglycine-generating enzyme required for sulfatase activity
LADASAVAQGAVPASRAVEDYDDGYPFTAPVGTFPPGPHGIYDLEGNVHEWVADDYSPTDPVQLGVMRGGSWDKYRKDHLFMGHREPVLPANASSSSGFRVVLARVPTPPDDVSGLDEDPTPEATPAPAAPSDASPP